MESSPTSQKSPSRVDDPLIGTRLGDYQVLEAIGEGGMGVVFKAVQPDIHKTVAIKVLRPELAHNPQQMERLRGEARVVNAIRHRGIVDIFGFGKTPDGRHYIVMEFLEGWSLSQVLKSAGPLAPAEAVAILEELLAALAAAHEAGVIHRDLKPTNVFLVEAPHGQRYVKLLDFGIAKRATQPHGTTPQTTTGQAVGTPAYMAPEQARGHSVSPLTDLYSLGVIAFQMVCGRRPFDAPSEPELMVMHIREEPPAPRDLQPNIPPTLEDLILQLLEKEPELRPASAGEALSRLQRVKRELAVAPASAPTPVVPRRARRWVRRQTLAVVGVGALTMSVGLAYGLWWFRDQQAPPAAPAPLPVVTEVATPRPVEPKSPEPAPTAPVPAPTPAPAPPKAHHPIDAAPSAADLLVQIARAERSLAAATAAGRRSDPAVEALLEAARERANAMTAAERRNVARQLDKLERSLRNR